jgi:hypothetical protein
VPNQDQKKRETTNADRKVRVRALPSELLCQGVDPTFKIGECACGEKKFEIRMRSAEQVALLTCASGHHSLLLDSRDYWMDVIQEGRPKRKVCSCGNQFFRVGLVYAFRETGDVRTIDIHLRCSTCSRDLPQRQWEFKYGPTDELVTRPLDPIENPWLRPKRVQITAYWRPPDAERFVRFLVQDLAARVFVRANFTEFVLTTFEETEFQPELKRDLYFTYLPDFIPPNLREPHKAAPILRVSSPFHIGWFTQSFAQVEQNLAHLHYIEYAEEVLVSMRRVKQPPEFIAFAQAAREWLAANFISSRGKNTADNPQEYQCVFANRRMPPPTIRDPESAD